MAAAATMEVGEERGNEERGGEAARVNHDEEEGEHDEEEGEVDAEGEGKDTRNISGRRT